MNQGSSKKRKIMGLPFNYAGSDCKQSSKFDSEKKGSRVLGLGLETVQEKVAAGSQNMTIDISALHEKHKGSALKASMKHGLIDGPNVTKKIVNGGVVTASSNLMKTPSIFNN